MWIMFGRIFQMGVSLVVSIFTARFLGPSNYGLINYVASIVAIFSVISSLGLENIVINEFVKRKNDHSKIMGSALVLRFFASLLSVLSILLVIYIVNKSDKVLLIVAFLSSMSLIFRSIDLIEYWYQYKLQSKTTVIIRTISYIVMTIYKIVLLIYSKSVEYFAASTLLESVVFAMLLVLVYKKQNRGNLVFSQLESLQLLKNSYHFILSGLVVVLYTEFDKIIIGEYLGTNSVGIYSTAINIAYIWTFVPLALTISFRPVILSMKDRMDAKYSYFLKGLFFLIFWFGIAVTGVLFIFSSEIVSFLYGIEYLGASKVLGIFSLSTVFSYLGIARGIWIVSENKNKYIKYYLFIGAFVSVGLNLILVKSLGIIGAAYTSLITQFTTLFIAPLLFKETRLFTRLLLESLIMKK